jgi:uncharacterized delta-60 repeat protein
MAGNGQRRGRRIRATLGALVACLLLGAPSALAADGDVDLTFNATGFNTIDFGGNDLGRDVALDGQGRSVVVGSDGLGGGFPDFAVARFLTSGQPDPSFDTDGKLSLTFGASDFAQAVAIQPDGKIVVAGYTSTGNDVAVARFNDDGTLDSAFNDIASPDTTNGDGRLRFSISAGTDQALDVKLDSSNRIVISGLNGTDADAAVARITPAGVLDASFNSGGGQPGVYTVPFSGSSVANALGIQSNGDIIAVGTLSLSTAYAVARINPAGTLQAAQLVDFGTDDRGTSVLIQPDDKIVLGGTISNEGLQNWGLARLEANAFTLDESFNATGSPTASNGNGRLSVNFGYDDFLEDMEFQAEGKILATGHSSIGDNPYDIMFAQVRLDGTLDPTFNDVAAPVLSDGDGKARVDLGSDEKVYGLAVQADGRLVVAGDTNAGSNPRDVLVARLNGPALPAASVNDATVAESGGNANFTVTLDKSWEKTVKVDYAAANGSATAGSDYTSSSGTLTFDPGQTSKTVAVPVSNDSSDEPNETFTLNLSNPQGASVADGQGVGTITDDDNPTLPGGADVTSPNTTALGFSAKVFRGAGSGPSASARIAATKHKVGTRVSFTLTEAATVTFTVERKSAGRKVGKKCVKPTKQNRTRKRCTRYVKVKGSFTRTGVVGKNSFKFRGRMGGKKLKPGSYRLVAVAKDAAGNKDKTPKRAGFKIARR